MTIASIHTSLDMMPNEGLAVNPERESETHKELINQAAFMDDAQERANFIERVAAEHFWQLNGLLRQYVLALMPIYDGIVTDIETALGRHKDETATTRYRTEVVSSEQLVKHPVSTVWFWFFVMVVLAPAMGFAEQALLAQLVVLSGLFSFTGDTLASWMLAGCFSLIPIAYAFKKRGDHAELFTDDDREAYRKGVSRTAGRFGFAWIVVATLLLGTALVSGGTSSDPFATAPEYVESLLVHIDGLEAILTGITLVLVLGLVFTQIVAMSAFVAFLWLNETARSERAKKTALRTSEAVLYHKAASADERLSYHQTAQSVAVIKGVNDTLEHALRSYVNVTKAEVERVRHAGVAARERVMTEMTTVKSGQPKLALIH